MEKHVLSAHLNIYTRKFSYHFFQFFSFIILLTEFCDVCAIHYFCPCHSHFLCVCVYICVRSPGIGWYISCTRRRCPSNQKHEHSPTDQGHETP